MQSEEGKFKCLLATFKRDDIAKLYGDFYTCLEVADSNLSRGGVRGIVEVQPSFSTILKDIGNSIGCLEKAFDNKKFGDELTKLRKVLLQQVKEKQQGLPQNINP